MKTIWNDLKQYIIGFLSGLITLLAVYILGRRGRAGDNERSSENAQNEALMKDKEFEELQRKKNEIEPAKATEEDSESYWNRELKK